MSRTFAHRFACLIAAAIMVSLAPSPAGAVIVPFTEHFASDSANWRDNLSNPLTWINSGGPDASGYVTTTFNFAGSAPTGVPVLFRAQDEFNSSNNAFVGDWIDAGVAQFSFFVRHDAGVPVTFFARFAGPANFPGASAIAFTPVISGVWTQITFDITPTNPAFIFEGPSTFGSVFGNVGHVQIGVDVPDALAGVNQPVIFDLDQVAIIPAPAALSLLLLGAMRTRRRRGRGH